MATTLGMSRMTYDLVAIGNPVYDFISTPRTASSRRILSGCSTNVCLAARRLGMKNVMLVGNVGTDFSQEFHAEMRHQGIKVINTGTTDRTTGFSIRYDEGGERTLRLIADADKIPVRRVWSECQQARYLLIGPVFCEIDVPEIIGLIESSHSRVFLDPQGLLRRLGKDGEVEHYCEKAQFKKLVELVDFIKPNRLEAQVITGCQNEMESAKKLVEWGAKVAIVTLGEKGSHVCDQRTCFHVPAFETTTVDPTGAGEFYAGAFLAELSRTGDLRSSCLYASAAASIMVETVRPDFPLTDEEVRRRTRLIGEVRGA
jgi:sugar/nucleoside kinase (ribokinase family)